MKDIFSFLAETAESKPHHAAIVDAEGALSFSELLLAAEKLANKLLHLGFRSGFPLALCSGNNRHFLVGLFALLRAGAVVIPIPPTLRPKEVAETLNEFGIVGVLNAPGTSAPQLEALERRNLENGYTLSLNDDAARKFEIFAPHIPNAAVVRPTSGTTGKSKGVILSHATVFARTAAAQAGLKLSEEDRICWVLPMAQHFVVSILLYVRYGITLVVAPEHYASTIVRTIRDFNCSVFYGTPLHYALCAEARHTLSPDSMSSLRLAISTSAAIREDTAILFQDHFRIPLRQVYGIIELGIPLGNIGETVGNSMSVGTPLPGYEAQILNSLGDPCGVGEVGELELRGPGLFDGYHSPAVVSADVLQHGFFSTGDLAELSPEGQISIRGRKKAVIVSAGVKIFPEEVEAVLETHPAVQASRVYGEEHDLVGEIVVAEVETRPGQGIDTEDVLAFCRRELSGLKAPQRIFVTSQIRRTSTGKPLRI